jgi:hypothetical protein
MGQSIEPAIKETAMNTGAGGKGLSHVEFKRGRDPRTIVKEAELLASPPETVATFLRTHTEKKRAEPGDLRVDEAMEDALRQRDEPVINLALAQFGRHQNVVHFLFEADEPCSAIRLAALANTNMCRGGTDLMSNFPEALIGGVTRGIDPDRVASWLCVAPDAELYALFLNPHLSNNFLVRLLKAKKPYDQIPDERLAHFVELLCENKRMGLPLWAIEGYENADLEFEMIYNEVFNAAWALSERVPVNGSWVVALCNLYERLPYSHNITDPLAVAARWRDDPEDEARYQASYPGFLSSFERVRRALARTALTKSPSDRALLKKLLSSQDRAFRAAAYSVDLSKEEFEAASKIDGVLFASLSYDNLNNWRTAERREALRRISDPLWYYRGEDNLKKTHPDWFEDEKPTPDPMKATATRANIVALTKSNEDLKERVNYISNVSGWLLLLGALIAIFWHH